LYLFSTVIGQGIPSMTGDRSAFNWLLVRSY
jgi:hypothetical protein